jgi:hypothetical protein
VSTANAINPAFSGTTTSSPSSRLFHDGQDDQSKRSSAVTRYSLFRRLRDLP